MLPPSKEALEERLKKAGRSEEAVQEALVISTHFLETDPTVKEGFDLVLVGEDIEVMFKSLEGYVYGKPEDEKPPNNPPEVEEPRDEVDATMVDAPTDFPTKDPPLQGTTQHAEALEKTAATENVEEAKTTMS